MAYTRASLSGACCASCAKGGPALGDDGCPPGSARDADNVCKVGLRQPAGTVPLAKANMIFVAAGILGVMYVLLRKK